MAYNVPHVTLDVAVETALTYIESENIPFLVSAPGVGKTTAAAMVARLLGAQLRSIRLNNIAPEEVAGLQYIDREGQRSTHLPPKWMPNPDGSDGPVLVFIDEITQAHDENRKAIMSALLERYLGDTNLPDNCHFMMAGNSAEDGTNVYEFDRATADRVGVIRIKTDVVAWCNDYAAENGIDISIVAFLRLRPDAFEMSAEAMKGDNVVAPSPRTWVAVNRFIRTAVAKNRSAAAIDAGVKGKLGIEIGTAYMSVRDQALQLKSVEELLSMPREDRARHTPKTLEALWTYCQGMIWHATTLQRCEEVYDLLESFEPVDDVPFYETRFTVAEMVLNRAFNLHGIEGIYGSELMQHLMVKWRREMNDVARAVPDMPGRDSGADGKLGLAA